MTFASFLEYQITIRGTISTNTLIIFDSDYTAKNSKKKTQKRL